MGQPKITTVPRGGTGVGTLTNHGVVIGQATANLVATTAGTAGQVLTSNGAGADPTFQAGSAVAFTAVTLIPQPNFQTAGTVTGKIQNTNTIADVGQVVIPVGITVNTISINVSAVVVAGTVKLGVYSEDAQTKLIDVTTATISATGVLSTALGAPVVLNPGVYYLAIVPVGTTTLTVSGWTTVSTTGLVGGVTAEPILEGQLTVSAGTLPASFNPVTDPSGSQNCVVYTRFDN